MSSLFYAAEVSYLAIIVGKRRVIVSFLIFYQPIQGLS